MSFLPRFRVLLRRVSQGQGMALVKERLIDLSTMGRGMKAIVYVSYAILAATAVLIALHGRLANTRSASAFGIAIPVGVLAASTPVLLLALALVLTGVMLSHRRLRYWAVGFVAFYMLVAADGARFGLMCCDPPDVLQHRPGFVLLLIIFEAVALVLLVTAWLMNKLRPAMVAALCAGSTGLAALLVWLISARYQHGFGEDLMLLSWVGLMFLIMPALLTVGFDMVEWAMLFGGFAGDAMHPEKWLVGIVLACAGVVLNLALAWHGLEWRHFGLIGIRAAILALATGLLLFACVWKREPLHHVHVRHWALLGVAALVIYGGYYLWGLEVNAPPPAYNYPGIRQFSIVYPQGWQPKLMDENHNYVVFRALGQHRFVVVVGQARSLGPIPLVNDIIPGGNEFPQTKLTFSSEKDHNWDRFETTVRNSKFGKDIHFVVWHLEIVAREWYLDSNWYIVGMSSPTTLAEAMPEFEAVRRSFTLLPKQVPSRLSRKLVYGLWSGLAALGLFWLFVRRHSTWWTAFAFLVAVAAVILAVNVAGAGFADEQDTYTRTQTFHCAQMIISALSLVVFFWLLRKTSDPQTRDRALHLTLALNISLLLANGLFALYAYGSSAGERSNIIKGIVILLALTVDIVTSGEITNRSSRLFPRNTRVLLFLGYVLLVAFGVFCFFPTTLEYSTTMSAFDSEQYVERGILTLGIPFLIVVFASRMAALLRSPEPEAPPVEDAVAEEVGQDAAGAAPAAEPLPG